MNTAYRGELLRYQLDQARVELAVADRGPLLTAVEDVRGDLPTLSAAWTRAGEHLPQAP